MFSCLGFFSSRVLSKINKCCPCLLCSKTLRTLEPSKILFGILFQKTKRTACLCCPSRLYSANKYRPCCFFVACILNMFHTFSVSLASKSKQSSIVFCFYFLTVYPSSLQANVSSFFLFQAYVFSFFLLCPRQRVVCCMKT